MTVLRKRWIVIFLTAVLACAAAMGIPVVRQSVLHSAGWTLVASDGAEPVDVIVVAIDADRAGVLEAADLVHSGLAKRVAVFADPPDTVDFEFLRRGVPYEDTAARSLQQLKELGIESVEEIPRSVTGSEDEGPVLAHWCDRNRFNSILVVSTSDHSRRLRRVLRRSMKGHATRITLRACRYSNFDPDRWWETRDGTRTEIEELVRLLLDIGRHPMS